MFHSHTQPWGTGDPQAWITKKYGPGYRPVPWKEMFMSVEWPDIPVMYRNVAQRTNAWTGQITLKSIPLHDAVLPEDLLFPIPLVDEALNPDTFSYHWQQLTYAFKLPSPANFPALTHLTDDERLMLRQYVKNARKLAKYSVFGDTLGSFDITHEDGERFVNANLPSEEAFTAASATFRQLNNQNDEASFDKVKAVLERAISQEGSSKRARGQKLLKPWLAARKQLAKQMIETIIARKLVGDKDERPPYTFEGVNPSKLIKTYNYGDTLHWGKEREALAELTADPDLEKFWMHCVLSSMLTMSHFYFGFARAVEAALGERR